VTLPIPTQFVTETRTAESIVPTNKRVFEISDSMGTARIVTDAGTAYIKALGTRQGPHPLACEWVGTQMAAWFGLPTFEFALLTVDASVDEIPFLQGGTAESGTAFVTRVMKRKDRHYSIDTSRDSWVIRRSCDVDGGTLS
jgi:hypothetical protein